MRDQDLFIRAAEAVKPYDDGTNNQERIRLQESEQIVRLRATRTLDGIFDLFDSEGYLIIDDEDTDRKYLPDFEMSACGFARDTVWSAETSTKVFRESLDSANHLKEVTRRWVCLEIPAEREFNAFAPDGYRIKKRVLIGAHDLRFSEDAGETWTDRFGSESLEIITGLTIEPIDEAYEHIPENAADNPFEDGPVILERLNMLHPVFEDEDEVVAQGFAELPIEEKCHNPHALIEGVNASVDDFGVYLEVLRQRFQ